MDPDGYPDDNDFVEMSAGDNLFDALVKDGAKLYIKDNATNEIMKVAVSIQLFIFNSFSLPLFIEAFLIRSSTPFI